MAKSFFPHFGLLLLFTLNAACDDDGGGAPLGLGGAGGAGASAGGGMGGAGGGQGAGQSGAGGGGGGTAPLVNVTARSSDDRGRPLASVTFVAHDAQGAFVGAYRTNDQGVVAARVPEGGGLSALYESAGPPGGRPGIDLSFRHHRNVETFFGLGEGDEARVAFKPAEALTLSPGDLTLRVELPQPHTQSLFYRVFLSCQDGTNTFNYLSPGQTSGEWANNEEYQPCTGESTFDAFVVALVDPAEPADNAGAFVAYGHATDLPLAPSGPPPVIRLDKTERYRATESAPQTPPWEPDLAGTFVRGERSGAPGRWTPLGDLDTLAVERPMLWGVNGGNYEMGFMLPPGLTTRHEVCHALDISSGAQRVSRVSRCRRVEGQVTDASWSYADLAGVLEVRAEVAAGARPLLAWRLGETGETGDGLELEARWDYSVDPDTTLRWLVRGPSARAGAVRMPSLPGEFAPYRVDDDRAPQRPTLSLVDRAEIVGYKAWLRSRTEPPLDERRWSSLRN